ncbi:hypothetical protein Tco_0970756 [Tanacetum coccineum]
MVWLSSWQSISAVPRGDGGDECAATRLLHRATVASYGSYDGGVSGVSLRSPQGNSGPQSSTGGCRRGGCEKMRRSIAICSRDILILLSIMMLTSADRSLLTHDKLRRSRWEYTCGYYLIAIQGLAIVENGCRSLSRLILKQLSGTDRTCGRVGRRVGAECRRRAERHARLYIGRLHSGCSSRLSLASLTRACIDVSKMSDACLEGVQYVAARYTYLRYERRRDGSGITL